MSTSLPTVRIANPARPDTFMVINRSDFGAGHDLWPEQDAGFIAPQPPRQPIDPAERDLAAEIMGRLVPAAEGLAEDAWLALTGPERLERMRAFEKMAHGEVIQYGPGSDAPYTVAKGPRGLWYVMQGEARISKGMPDEAAAQAERSRMFGG